MIGAIFVKFSQLILLKIIKLVATTCQIVRLKCTKFNFRPRACYGSSQHSRDALIGFKGLLLRGGEGVEGGEEMGFLYFFSVDLRPWLPTGTHRLCRWP